MRSTVCDGRTREATASARDGRPPGSSLRLDVVHAAYGKKEVLCGLTLNVPARQVSLLIGANGAGKSTALKVAAGLLAPRAGAVLLDGDDITRLSVAARVRAGVSYVAQGGRIFASLSVSEHLELGLWNTATAQRVAVIERVLAIFPSLHKRPTVRAGLLSGGQRQSLAVAMALCQSPRLLLLDEPTAGLAPAAAQAMLDAIQAAAAELGTTVLMVEQRVSQALRIAHRATALAAGALAGATDTPSDWLRPGALDAFFFAKD